MNGRARSRRMSAWLAAIAIAALALSAVRCDRTVPLGVDPASDAAAFFDASSDAAAPAD